MAYNNAIPQPGDLLSKSQADLLANFAEINTFVAINHEAFNSVAPHAQGKHKQVEMPVQAAGPAADATQWSMYCKNNGAGVPSLFLQPSVGLEVDITTAIKADIGQCTLPCGIRMKWGNFALGAGTTTVNPTFVGMGLTNFTANCYMVNVTVLSPRAGAQQDYVLHVTAKNNAGFTVTRDPGYNGTAANFYWFALGD